MMKEALWWSMGSGLRQVQNFSNQTQTEMLKAASLAAFSLEKKQSRKFRFAFLVSTGSLLATGLIHWPAQGASSRKQTKKPFWM